MAWVQISVLLCDFGQDTEPLCVNVLMCKMGENGSSYRIKRVNTVECSE